MTSSPNMVQWGMPMLWQVAQECRRGEVIAANADRWSISHWQMWLPLDRYGFVTFENPEDVKKLLQDVSEVSVSVYFNLSILIRSRLTRLYQCLCDNPCERTTASVSKTRNSPSTRLSVNSYFGVSNGGEHRFHLCISVWVIWHYFHQITLTFLQFSLFPLWDEKVVRRPLCFHSDVWLIALWCPLFSR